VSNILHTLALIEIDAEDLSLLVASWLYMTEGLFLLVVHGYRTMLMLHSAILEHVFSKYIGESLGINKGTDSHQSLICFWLRMRLHSVGSVL
jgi:hypothetical protein